MTIKNRYLTSVPGHDRPGDIYEDADGMSIVTPSGHWNITETDALGLIAGLSSMLNHRLNRPWSNEGPSTILTRGTRTEADQ